MTDEERKEAIVSPNEAWIEANQSLVESLSAAQESNLKYAQSAFENTITLLKSQVESTNSLLEQWEQQVQEQQGNPLVVPTSFEYLRAPLAVCQQALEGIEAASKQGLESFRKANESFQQVFENYKQPPGIPPHIPFPPKPQSPK